MRVIVGPKICVCVYVECVCVCMYVSVCVCKRVYCMYFRTNNISMDKKYLVYSSIPLDKARASLLINTSGANIACTQTQLTTSAAYRGRGSRLLATMSAYMA